MAVAAVIGGAREEERTEGGGTSAAWRGARGAAEMGGNEQWEARSYAAHGGLTRCARWRDRDCGGVVDAAEGPGPCGMPRTREECGHVVAQPWPAKGISGWR